MLSFWDRSNFIFKKHHKDWIHQSSNISATLPFDGSPKVPSVALSGLILGLRTEGVTLWRRLSLTGCKHRHRSDYWSNVNVAFFVSLLQFRVVFQALSLTKRFNAKPHQFVVISRGFWCELCRWNCLLHVFCFNHEIYLQNRYRSLLWFV